MTLYVPTIADKRRRSPKRISGRRLRSSKRLLLIMALYTAYTLVPLLWLVINATKSQAGMLSTFGLWFDGSFELISNIQETLTYRDGIFMRWLLNTLLYVVVGAGGATLLATLAGYALSRFQFPGRRAVFAAVVGAIAVPGTALAVPTFLLFATLHLTNTPWSIILPSLVSPFGLYLVWSYADSAVAPELLEAGRMDGAGELRIFRSIVFRLLGPGIVTALLFAIVNTWNNYFLPLIMLNEPRWYPLTVGLAQWNAQASGAGAEPIYHLVVTGAFLTLLPILAVFLYLQRFWESGLSGGAVKQ